MTARPYSLLRKAAEITGWTHGELAELTGFSRPQIQAIIGGRTPRVPDGRHRQKALLGAVSALSTRRGKGSKRWRHSLDAFAAKRLTFKMKQET